MGGSIPSNSAAAPPRWRAVWMDQGGTFTDVVRVGADGSVQIDKVLSDRADLVALGAGAIDVRRGTTVATNALLEGATRPVLLLTNRGLGDLPWIGDQTRPDLFALDIRRPAPPCAGVVEVDGRIGADGRVRAPAEVSVEAVAAWVARGVESAAVVLAHGPLAPDEERRLAAVCRSAGMPLDLVLGGSVQPAGATLRSACVLLALVVGGRPALAGWFGGGSPAPG